MPQSNAVALPRSCERANSPDLRKTSIHPDYGYPVARSRDVKPGKEIGFAFAGDPIVLMRTEAGKVFALDASLATNTKAMTVPTNTPMFFAQRSPPPSSEDSHP